MKLFFADLSQNIEISFDKLVEDINTSTNYPLYLKSSDYYEVFKCILVSLIHDKEICLLDNDFSEKEVEALLGKEDTNQMIEVPVSHFNDFNEILKELDSKKKWRLSLFTSGTTGLPKRISHNFENLVRNCKGSSTHAENVWGFAYNPTHMAGLQVYFQALLNGNTIVRLFNLGRDQIFQSINSYLISNISATPTFYRLLLPVDEEYKSVQRLTSGGEKFDSKLKDQLKLLFPNSKLLNVYASTEAGSIFAAEGEEFFIRERFKQFVKIDNEELLLHRSLLGEGAEKNLIGDWYLTGDLVEIISEQPLRFKFLSRKNEMINVGGYKVNPNEVEEVMLNYDGIMDVRVYGKPNSVLGNIICSEVVVNKTLTVSEIRSYLASKLQEFKIPRLINFVDKLEKTRTGKKKR
jgi:acyl-coenzyme A synthetase/AMP-(fatty) acid ligase